MSVKKPFIITDPQGVRREITAKAAQSAQNRNWFKKGKWRIEPNQEVVAAQVNTGIDYGKKTTKGRKTKSEDTTETIGAFETKEAKFIQPEVESFPFDEGDQA